MARAAAVIENARDIRSETHRLVDTATLQRLHRELLTKVQQIERLTVRPRKKSHRLL